MVQKLLYIADNVEDEPELAAQTIEQIRAARQRLQDGDFVTEAEDRQSLGID